MIIKRIPYQWKETQREDLNLAQTAQEMGYSVEAKGLNLDIKEKLNYIPLNPLSFEIKDKTIWKCIMSREIVWRCADLKDNRYQNHRTYKTLLEALEKEK